MDKLSWLARFQAAQAETAGGPGARTVFLLTVIALFIILSVFALMTAIFLALSYSKYHHQANSLGRRGGDIARQMLDEHDLKKIKVSASGSILYGNSYSRLLKKVRLRRPAWGRASVYALAMAVQKTCLALLDDREDRAGKAPRASLMYLGPLAFLPLMAVGAVLDAALAASGWLIFAFTLLALALFGISLVLAVRGLGREKAAQAMALELLERDGFATPEERKSCKKLFRLYNIEHINNMFLGLLELIYRAIHALSCVIQGDSAQEDA